MKYPFFLVMMMALMSPLRGQVEVPPLSPSFILKGSIGFCEVEVEYSRPSARGRQVAGNLIPYGEVWRTGANASTKISFSEDVKLEGNHVPAGKYALYTIFQEDSATIILSKNLNLWGSIGYDQGEDIVRFDVKVKHPSSHYETFTISFSDFTRSSANLNMKWEHTKAMFKIESEIDERIMNQIQAELIDSESDNIRSYLLAANYYLDTDRDPGVALKWINKVIDNSMEEQYWVLHSKAKLLAKLGNIDEAIKIAMRSSEVAREAGNPDYVKLNEDLINHLKK